MENIFNTSRSRSRSRSRQMTNIAKQSPKRILWGYKSSQTIAKEFYGMITSSETRRHITG